MSVFLLLCLVLAFGLSDLVFPDFRRSGSVSDLKRTRFGTTTLSAASDELSLSVLCLSGSVFGTLLSAASVELSSSDSIIMQSSDSRPVKFTTLIFNCLCEMKGGKIKRMVWGKEQKY